MLGAAHGLPWIGALVALAIVVAGTSRARRGRRANFALVGAAAAVGALFETLLVQSGWVCASTRGMLVDGHGALLDGRDVGAVRDHAQRVAALRCAPHRWLAALLGAVGGPAAYYAGARLGALEFAVRRCRRWPRSRRAGRSLTPLLLRVARRLDGYARP